MLTRIGRLVVIAAAPALLALPAPAHAAKAPERARVVDALSAEAELVSQIVTQTNRYRHAAGCRPVAVDDELVAASVEQSRYMAATGRFGHLGRGGSTFAARARSAGYTAPSGENIAWGYPTATEVMDAWMASPPHRANILDCTARSTGAGVRYADDGIPYYTQVFGRR